MLEPMFWPGQLFNPGEMVHSTTLFENNTDIRELVVTQNPDGTYSAYVYSWYMQTSELYADDFDDDRSAFCETRDWLTSDSNWTRVDHRDWKV